MTQPYIPSEGFLNLSATTAGVVYRFRRPVSKVTITASADVRVGVNALIEGVTPTQKTGTTQGGEGMEKLTTLSAAQALENGYPLNTANDRTVTFEAPIDDVHGRRGILLVWAITASDTANISGGSVGV